MYKSSFLLKSLYSKRQVIIRLILVWLLGLLIFNYDERNSFDVRFKLRAEQPVDPNIVLININKKTWDRLLNPSFPALLQAARPLSDSYFWSTPIWTKLLKKILKEEPSVVMVDLFFDRSTPMTWTQENLFKLPNVIWRAEPDERFGYKRPRFSISSSKNGISSSGFKNIALGEVFRDFDYTARRYKKSTPSGFLENIPFKVASEFAPLSTKELTTSIPFINFRGPAETYPTISIETVLSGYFPKNFFKGKIIIIGSNAMESHFIKTPSGLLSRSEYHANVIDNILNDRWIKAFPRNIYALYLLLVICFCFITLHYFRQIFAISCLILITVSSTALSLIFFDIYNIWFPILSPAASTIISYIIILNHLLSKSEYQTWAVQKKEESTREMNELKNNFVSLFSHDLKTPLAKIHALSDGILLTKDHSKEEVKSSFLKIQKETKELDRYIQSILQVTRIEAGQFNLDITPRDINEIINSCISSLQPLLLLKNITIEFNEEPLFPIDIDAKLIKEVFLNILDNSIKYCPENSKIVISSEDSDETVKIKFLDNGPGIPKSEQNKIFEKFYRSSSQLSNKKGTGLGLYLVRYFIEIHHGTVDIESSPGQGTSFIINLPYEHEQEVNL